MNEPAWRAGARARLASEWFDLVVLGAGITGAAIARDAAGAGVRVALVDAGDIAGATSSASSKLLHGGLRYLAQGRVRLVHQAQRERVALVRGGAGGHAWPLRFVLPVLASGPYRAGELRAGLAAYSALGHFRGARPRIVRAGEARQLVPDLAAPLAAAAVYEEAQTDDARLTLHLAREAAAGGAVVCTYLRAGGFARHRGRLAAVAVDDRLTGDGFEIRFRHLVNATGPWLDHVRRLAANRAVAPLTALSKGIHVTLPLERPWRAAVALPVARRREIHLAPWHGVLLVGSTDAPFHSAPETVAATTAEVGELLSHAAAVLGPAAARPERVLAAFAGLRVLPTGALARGADTTREVVFERSADGLVSIAGGKLTTHRRASRRALAAIGVRVPRPSPRASGKPRLPVADGDDPLARHLRELLGTAVPAFLQYAACADDRLRPVAPGGPDVWGQVDWAIEREWAVTVDDVVRRRTTLAARGLDTRPVRDLVAARLRRHVARERSPLA